MSSSKWTIRANYSHAKMCIDYYLGTSTVPDIGTETAEKLYIHFEISDCPKRVETK
jgi:hypothetical protein